MGATICRQADAVFDAKQHHCTTSLYPILDQYLIPAQGTFGNLGMYASGIPLGLLVDAKGPRPGVLIGAVLLGAGYYPIKRGNPRLCFRPLWIG